MNFDAKNQLFPLQQHLAICIGGQGVVHVTLLPNGAKPATPKFEGPASAC